MMQRDATAVICDSLLAPVIRANLIAKAHPCNPGNASSEQRQFLFPCLASRLRKFSSEKLPRFLTIL
jgi:hypothetical protein